MTEVYFRGEWIDKSLVNLWLSKPENQRMLEEEEEEAKQKAEEQERKKQQQQRQRAERRTLTEKIEEKLRQIRQELPPGVHYDDDPKTYAKLLERAYNMVEADSKDEEYRKQQAEWQRQEEEASERR
jgi:hypothetical protein